MYVFFCITGLTGIVYHFMQFLNLSYYLHYLYFCNLINCITGFLPLFALAVFLANCRYFCPYLYLPHFLNYNFSFILSLFILHYYYFSLFHPFHWVSSIINFAIICIAGIFSITCITGIFCHCLYYPTVFFPLSVLLVLLPLFVLPVFFVIIL